MEKLKGLIPEDPTSEASYILGQEYTSHVNFVSWSWIPHKGWRSQSPKYNFTYSPYEMAEANWQIVEETTENVYIVKDIWERIGSRSDESFIG